jgi:hypothetical protein
MNNDRRQFRFRVAAIILASAAALLLPLHSQAPQGRLLEKNPVMTRHAEGAFDVKTTPLTPDVALEGTLIGRYALVKQFHGDLEGTSKGEMLSSGEPGEGNAGYTAMEWVTGSLHGHKGIFALQHFGVIDHGRQQLLVMVVPGSGSGELTGLAGTFTITIADGKHSYSFDYTLTPPEQ